MYPKHPQMTSAYPYFLAARVHLVNALWAWIVENNMTPQILVDATIEGVEVPTHAIKDGKIVLNISTRSTTHLSIRDDSISFGTRFNGAHFNVCVPMKAVEVIFARETGVGMGFPKEEASQQSGEPVAAKPALSDKDSTPPPSEATTPASDETLEPTTKRRGHLTLVASK